jgi:hypothetical protein
VRYSSAELERLVDRAVARAMPALERRLAVLVAELRDDVHEELAGMHRRIDEVHSRALRELTRLQQGRHAE